MNILMIAINDPAGTAIAFTRALNQYSEHTCRLITKEIRYNFMFEKDLHLPWLEKAQWDEVEWLLIKSDIFHFHMTADEKTPLGPFIPADYLKGKAVVHHHHGHPDFRGNPEKYQEKYRHLNRKHLLVSTPDLLHLLPSALWLPNPVPADDPLYRPIQRRDDRKVRICHSPTKTALKNTVEFESIMSRLTHKYPEVEKVLIQNTPHKECLRIKQACHMLFDHMQGYFGLSSLEALSQGSVVFAGLDEWNIQNIKAFTGSDHIPWVIARDEEALASAMERAVCSPEFRERQGFLSRRFIEAYWNEKKIVERLIDFYHSEPA